MFKDNKLSALMEAYPKEPQRPKEPKKPKNATQEQMSDFLKLKEQFNQLHKEYMIEWDDFYKRKFEADEEIERCIKEESGFLEIPNIYQKRAWEVATQGGLIHNETYVYITLCNIAWIFKAK